MDGLGRAVGSAIPVELGGKTYFLRPLVLNDLGAIEQFILANRRTPLAIAKQNLDDLPLELQKHLLTAALDAEQAFPNYIPPYQVEAFMMTDDGVALTFWLMARKEQPSLTFGEIKETFKGFSKEEIRKFCDVRDQASGTDHLGNETGPASATSESRAATTEKTDVMGESQNALTGDSLSGDSLKPIPA